MLLMVTLLQTSVAFTSLVIAAVPTLVVSKSSTFCYDLTTSLFVSNPFASANLSPGIYSFIELKPLIVVLAYTSAI